MAKKPLEIDACAGSQLRDTQGEMLSVEGADISDLQAGKGRWNDNHGKGFFNSIGRITGAKKIFKAEDCENDRHRYYWEKVKAPFIYCKGYLYSDEDHPNAKAAAAILRNIHKSDTPLKLKASVEGGVLSRGISDSSLLARTKIHSVALTFTPANNATLVEPTSMEKSLDEAADLELMKSVAHLAETNIPSFRHIVRDASAGRIRANLERICELMKGDDSVDLPTKQEILNYALEAKVRNNVVRIHEMVEAIRHENMEKGLKNAAMGAAMMGAAALAPSSAQAPAQNTVQVQQGQDSSQNLSRMPANHQAAYAEAAKRNPMLGAIGKIESSGGVNYAHKPMTSGMHAGHTAGGMFGMMPHAAEYILRNDPALAKKYPQLAEAAKDINKNHGTFTTTFNKDPKVAIEFAEALLKRNKSKTKSPEMLVHSWNHGLKGTWDKYKDQGEDAIKGADYVSKVMKVLAQKKQPAARKPAMKKALTAGYGGAGAPSGRSGGGVLQSEALDDGRSFKYVTCDDCGKEQVYAKHQVKCRECKKSWSLDKLSKVMLGLKG
jgi:ribosomal protein L12E/L44/L45/RPP1/RPP2